MAGLYPSEPQRTPRDVTRVLPLPLCPWRGLREVPLTGVDWLLVPGSGAAPKGSTKWHQCVDKWARFGKFKKGWFSSLQRIREREGSIQDTAPNSPGLLLSLRLY